MRQRGRYSYYDEHGMDNPAWKGKSIVEMLKAVVSDPETSPEQKSDAIAILSYIARRTKAKANLLDLDQHAWGMLVTIDAHSLWEHPEGWEIAVVKGEERVRQIESDRPKSSHGS
jgi:metal-responsive CopG/Arc/MetJ family transcriptional regulator